MTAKKKGGGKLSRSEVVTVRLDPKLRFAAELAARKQRRTLSSFVEWAVEEAIKKVFTGDSQTIEMIVSRIWDVEDADRFVKLALDSPELLTFDEERLWKIISEKACFWYQDWDHGGGWELTENHLNFKEIRENWPILNKIIAGEATTADLPNDEEVPEVTYDPDGNPI